MPEKICQYKPCSKPFTPARNNTKTQKYCSRSCRDKVQHRIHGEERNARHRIYYAENRENLVAAKAAYTSDNREKLNAKQREKYEKTLKAQPNIVLICDNQECVKEFLVTEKRALAGKRFCSTQCANHAWRETHKEELIAYGKEKYFRNRDKKCAYNKAYRTEHLEELLSKDREYYANHREEREEYRKKYYVENHEEILSKASDYYDEHREERIAYNHKYYFEHYEKAMAYQTDYRDAHREEMREKNKAYRKANPGKVKNNLDRYRARKAAAPINDLTCDQWQEILSVYHYRCVYCDETCWRCRQRKHVLTKDHIIPLSKGGSHTVSNIVPACKKCNSKKGNRAPLKPVQPLLFTIS